eukprot:COSAG02_NODE_395_length_23127_cov_130.205663_3_plen_402_part_00
MPAARRSKAAVAAAPNATAVPSGPELFARVVDICQTADHSSLTKKGVRMLLADDFGKTFVEANKDAIGQMVLEAIKKMTAKKKRSTQAAPSTPSGKATPMEEASQPAASKRKRKNADVSETPSHTKRGAPRSAAAAGSKAKARASTVRAMASVATPSDDGGRTRTPASQPGDDPGEPDTTLADAAKPQVKRQRKRKLDMDQQRQADGDMTSEKQDAEMEQRAASLAPPRSGGVVSAVWAAASQTPGMRNNAATNAAKRRQKQLEKAADTVEAALALSNAAPEYLRSAARLAAPFPILAPEVSELNERADTLEKEERARLEAQAQKEATERRRRQEEMLRAEKIRANRAERAEIAKAARAARRAQQAKDEKLRDWEEERRAVEQANLLTDQENLDDPIPEED